MRTFDGVWVAAWSGGFMALPLGELMERNLADARAGRPPVLAPVQGFDSMAEALGFIRALKRARKMDAEKMGESNHERNENGRGEDGAGEGLNAAGSRAEAQRRREDWKAVDFATEGTESTK